MNVTDRISESITEFLQTADNGFDRETNAGIYEMYQQYIKLVGYPYIDAVVDWITENYNVDSELRKKLSHEVYLASQQAREDETAQRAEKMAQDGYKRADDTLEVGKLYELIRYDSGSILGDSGLRDSQRVKFVLDADSTPFLMPTRNTRRGYRIGYGSEYWVKELVKG